MKKIKKFRLFESDEQLGSVPGSGEDFLTKPEKIYAQGPLYQRGRTFDDDFGYNLEARELVSEMFKVPQDKLLVIMDMKAVNTGNLFFEYENKGIPSGIATSGSLWTFVVLDGSLGGLFLETRKLKKALRQLKSTHTRMGGDNKESKGILIKISELMKLVG